MATRKDQSYPDNLKRSMNLLLDMEVPSFVSEEAKRDAAERRRARDGGEMERGIE